jgi:hypothetical protein
MFAGQLRTALIIAWLIVSTLVLPVLLAPLLVSPDVIFSLAPRCERKVRSSQECALCGMTAGFVLISHGRLNDAVRRNKASIPLYSALIWNECAAAWYAMMIVVTATRPVPKAARRIETEEFSCKS